MKSMISWSSSSSSSSFVSGAAAITTHAASNWTSSSCIYPTTRFRFRRLCVAAASPINPRTTLISESVAAVVKTRRNTSSSIITKKDIAAQLKEKWLDSLSSPFATPDNSIAPDLISTPNATTYDSSESSSSSSLSSWVIGVDPDVSGAIALLKPDYDYDCNTHTYTPQVFDSPHVTVLIGKRSRRRLDAKSIVNLIKSFDAPVGTTAYLEQSIPFPQDGKQGWWSGGFGYGLWIGILVASGFSVVPVPSLAWKNKFCLSGSRSSKDDSRDLASTLFPTMSPLLKRKKDHGRAEALLIAAYGKGLKLSTNIPVTTPDDLTSHYKMDQLAIT